MLLFKQPSEFGLLDGGDPFRSDNFDLFGILSHEDPFEGFGDLVTDLELPKRQRKVHEPKPLHGTVRLRRC